MTSRYNLNSGVSNALDTLVSAYQRQGQTWGNIGNQASNYFKNENALQQQELDNKRKAEQDSQAKQLFDLKMDEAAKAEAKDQATNEALMALIYPDKYKASKLATEQEAINQSINALPDNEKEATRAMIAKEYNPAASGNEWARLATINPLADASKVLNTQNSLMQAKLNDPTSAEYKAKENADYDAWRKKEQFKLDTEAEKEQKALDQSQRLADILIGTDLYKTPEKGRDVTTIDGEIAKLQGQLRDSKDPTQRENIGKSLSKLAQERVKARNAVNTLKTDEELRKEILTKVKEQKVPLTPTVQSAIGARIKNLQSDPKAVQEAAKVASYKKVLTDLGLDVAGVNNSDVLAKMYEAQADKDSKSKDKTTYGAGPLTRGMLNDLSIDDYSLSSEPSHQQQIIDTAKKYKITDSELAKMLEVFNNQDLTPRLSGSIKDDIIEYIKEKQKIKN